MKLLYTPSAFGPLKAVKFKKRIGIELTFVPEVYDKALDRSVMHPGWRELAEKYKKLVQKFNIQGHSNIHADPGCVEFPSPILTSWSAAKNWYDQACMLGKMLGLVPEQEDQEGGMGHIHIELAQEEAAMVHADLIARPYMTWIMATPNGSKYCKSLARGYKDVMPLRLLQPGSGIVNLVERTPSSYSYSSFDSVIAFEGFDSQNQKYIEKLHPYSGNVYNLLRERFTIAPYNFGYGTLEWRAFDSAGTWEEQEANIAFLQRYCHVMTKQKFGAMPWPNRSSRKDRDQVLREIINTYRTDKDRCAREFKELIVSTLELPWDSYEWLLDRNLDAAFEWGRRF